MQTSATTFTIALLVTAGCARDNPGKDNKSKTRPVPAFKFHDKAANLKKLMETLNTAPENGSNSQYERLAVLARALIPNQHTYALAFKPGAMTPRIRRHLALFRKTPVQPRKVVALFIPRDRKKTVVRVYSVRVKDLDPAKHPTGSPIHLRFKGPRVAAPRYLKPDLQIHQVEFTRPGEPTGDIYHMFVWDGRQWKTLGPFWSNFRMRRFFGLPNLFDPQAR